MRLWIVEVGEPLPGIDAGERDWRAGMLAKAAANHGHAVTWWASTFHHSLKRHRFDSSRTVKAGPGLDIRCLHGPGYTTNTSLKRVRHHLALARAFAKEARQQPKPDAIFCCLPTLELADAAVTFGRERGVPVVIDVRDLWPEHYVTLAPPWARGIARTLLFTEFRRARAVMKNATGIVAISDTFLDWGLRKAERPRRPADGVFPMGYPSAPAALDVEVVAKREALGAKHGMAADRFVLIFVGTFVSSFDLTTVIRAARALKDEAFRFVLVGEGGEGAALRSLAAGLPNVVFTGWADQASIRALLGLASVGLAPYRAGASMSLPNKPFEYLSAGLPILSSLGGELGHLIAAERIGLNYRAGDAEALVAAARRLASDGPLRGQMAANASALFAARFREDIVYTNLMKHMELVAGSPA